MSFSLICFLSRALVAAICVLLAPMPVMRNHLSNSLSLFGISISVGTTTPDAVLLIGSFVHVWALQSLLSSALFSDETRAWIAICFLTFVFMRTHTLTYESRALRAELRNFRTLQSQQSQRTAEAPKPEAELTSKVKSQKESETDEMRELLARRKRAPGEGRAGDQAVVEELKRKWASEGSGNQTVLPDVAPIGSDMAEKLSKPAESTTGAETSVQRQRSPPPPPPPRKRVVAQDIWVAGPSSRKV